MAGSDPKRFRQLAALPFRRSDDGLEILLVTSRDTHRWIIPKGWPMKGKKPHRCAEREALEEAGVKGRIARKAVGAYEAWKRLEDHFILCDVKVYPLQVEQQRKRWREQGQRQVGWFKAIHAADLVDEPGLSTLIRGFAAKELKKMATTGPKDRKTQKAGQDKKAPAAPLPTGADTGGERDRQPGPGDLDGAGHGR